ncbi:MAG: site-specific integrase [Armatimonadota bacterium]
MLSAIFPNSWARFAALPLLGNVWEGFCQWLSQLGYPADAIKRRVQAGPWLEDALRAERVHSLSQLTAPVLRALSPRPPRRWTEELACSLVDSLIDYLGEQGVLAPLPTTPAADQVASYRRYLASVRGLAPSTVVREGRRVYEFLRFLDYDSRPERVMELDVVDIETFIAQEGRRLGRATMQKVTATLRSFLRFLAARSEAPSGLDAQIDSPRCFRQERLPRAISWDSVRSILRVIDRQTPKGCRDYAMLLLIATYGLRVSEVAELTFEDLSWRTRQIRAPRPKMGTPLLLPLTDEAATAILDYLRHGRGPSSDRHVFLRVRIPPGPIKPSAVCDAFDVWAKRAGIQFSRGAGGPHCVRHSLAMHLLREGSSLKMIGDLLGHRSPDSTSVYLRLQIEDLRDVALPLPRIPALEVQP